VYTVTGERASEAEVDRMIETGESETIFRAAAPLARTASGQVRRRPACWQRPLPVTTVAYNGKGKEGSRVLCYS